MAQSHRPALEDTGSGLDYGSPPDHILGDITPVDQFFIRSHAPSPTIDASIWTLRIEGEGVRHRGALEHRGLRVDR